MEKEIKFYEDDIKDMILDKRHIFINKDEKHTILFEKGIAINSTIADCIIFSESGHIIGVEIKTERDTVRRLNKQLKNYSLVCDEVYVLCHDDHIDNVEGILNRHGHSHVGIISYTEFQGEAVVGVYKEPSKSPTKKVNIAFQMLWRQEIVQLLGSFKRQVKTLEELGLKTESVKSRSAGLHGLYVQSNASKKYLRKTDMINMIVNRLGEEESNMLLCAVFIHKRIHIDRLLKFHHFRA